MREDELVLIDAGMSLRTLTENIEEENFNPLDIKHCILTHCHIDHIGACSDLQKFNNKVKFYAHNLDADAIEQKGHDGKTAAGWYGVKYQPVKLERRLKKEVETLELGIYDFQCIHTPGHTPGSISVLIQVEKKNILFGQDIHGPFMASFGSNLDDYQKSMQKLLDLKADILCEGHFGIIQPAERVHEYIKGYMDENQP